IPRYNLFDCWPGVGFNRAERGDGRFSPSPNPDKLIPIPFDFIYIRREILHASHTSLQASGPPSRLVSERPILVQA
ncbi:unnamed protein product, partial [Tuber aestivum]